MGTPKTVDTKPLGDELGHWKPPLCTCLLSSFRLEWIGWFNLRRSYSVSSSFTWLERSDVPSCILVRPKRRNMMITRQDVTTRVPIRFPMLPKLVFFLFLICGELQLAPPVNAHPAKYESIRSPRSPNIAFLHLKNIWFEDFLLLHACRCLSWCHLLRFHKICYSRSMHVGYVLAWSMRAL